MISNTKPGKYYARTGNWEFGLKDYIPEPEVPRYTGPEPDGLIGDTADTAHGALLALLMDDRALRLFMGDGHFERFKNTGKRIRRVAKAA